MGRDRQSVCFYPRFHTFTFHLGLASRHSVIQEETCMDLWALLCLATCLQPACKAEDAIGDHAEET